MYNPTQFDVQNITDLIGIKEQVLSLVLPGNKIQSNAYWKTGQLFWKEFLAPLIFSVIRKIPAFYDQRKQVE